jgi:hypothetical protein
MSHDVHLFGGGMTTSGSYAGEIAAELDAYRERGQKEAAAHRPPTDANHLDQHESTLQAEASKWLAVEQKAFNAVLTDASRALVELRQKTIELQGRVSQLLLDDSLRAAVEADMSEERSRLVSAIEARMRAEVDWRHLRARHKISLQAAYPDSMLWHMALIAALALVETCINAFFFENAHGLLGGFSVALGVALVNMVGAMLLGFGYRYKNLLSIDSRILGWSCLVLFAVLCIYCNALFATFRSEYQVLTDPSDPMQVRQGFKIALNEARRIFILDMHIADLSSFVLFGLGIVLSGLAFYKGYTLDDRYPGHGKLDRAVNAAREVEIHQQEALRSRIKDMLHRSRAEVQSVIHEPAQLVSLAGRRILEIGSAQSLLISQAKNIQRDFSLVLTSYRNANVAVRATLPPEYFKHIPDITALIDITAADEHVTQLTAIQEEIRTYREQVQDTLNAKLQRLQGDAATVMNTAFAAYLQGVEEEAKEGINRKIPLIHRPGSRRSNA